MLTFLSQFELAHPGRLTILLVLPLVVFIAWWYARFDSSWQRTAALVCRMSMVALLVFAMSGPFLGGLSHRRYVVLAVDGSASVSGAGREAADKYVKEVRGASWLSKTVVLNFGAEPESRQAGGALDKEGSDPGRAILAAAASIPTDYVPEVVLISDGRQTRGDLLTAAERAGVPVSVVALPAFSEPEVAVASVIAPAQSQRGERISVQIVVEANGENSGQVEITNSTTKKAISAPLKTVAGTNPLTIAAECGLERATQFEVRLTGFQDQHAENNVAGFVVYSAPPIKALLVDSDAPRAQKLAAVLKEQRIDAQSLGGIPKSAEELAPFDLLVLSAPAPKSISAEQAAALETFVRERGGGLIVSGTAATFGEGAYQGTPLEKLLPVAALPTSDQRKESLALTLIVDRSDSMATENRMQMAKEAARQVVEFLSPQDKVGVIAFGSDSKWISEIRPCSDKAELLKSIATLESGGQTDMYSALAKTYLAMDQVDADRRHVILLTDSKNDSYPGDFQGIANRMADSKITVSTVSISKLAEQSILKDISRAAKGRHYHCDDPADVPKILLQETKSAAAIPVIAFKPLVFRQLPGLDVAAAPVLTGSVSVSPKPRRSELLLIDAEGDPLLSWWRYGDGVTVALAADVQPWSAWPGYGKFWGRLVSHAARDTTPREYTFTLRQAAGRGIATLEALTAEGKFLNGAKAVLNMPAQAAQRLPEAPSSGALVATDMVQTAPGRYQAEFDLSPFGVHEATVVLTDPAQPSRELFRANRALVPGYSDEFRIGPTDENLLREVARASGGAYNPKAEEIFAPTERGVQTKVPLGHFFVLAAALFLVADVAVRRYHEWIGTKNKATRRLIPQESHVGGANEAA